MNTIYKLRNIGFRWRLKFCRIFSSSTVPLPAALDTFTWVNWVNMT